jgi:tRNA pseudouridine synthase 9
MAETAVDEIREQLEALKPSTGVTETPCDPWPEPYYLEGGLRRVAPYFFKYKTYCKQRWRGREIGDIFGSEFRDRSKEYYVGLFSPLLSGLYGS